MSTAKQRRAAAHRKLEAQIEARKAAERQRKQQMIILSLVAAVAIIGLVTWMAVSSTSSSAKKAANACGYAADGTGEPTVGLPSADGLKKTGTVNIGMTTDRGEIKLELDRASAPCAVNSFTFLSDAHFFCLLYTSDAADE